MPRERKFDHDKARKLRAEGWSYQRIADRLCVSPESIRQACDPAVRAEAALRAYLWTRQGSCPDCGAQTTRQRLGLDSRCKACAAILRGTSARPGELRCHRCGEWKPDEEFPRNRSESRVRRGRHGCCRACCTIAKREWRHANPGHEAATIRKRRMA